MKIQTSNTNYIKFENKPQNQQNNQPTTLENTVPANNYKVEQEYYKIPASFYYEKYTKNKKQKTNKTIWSSEKIMDVVEIALAEFGILINDKNLSSQTVNDLLLNLLPENIASNIEIKDYNTDFENFIKEKNHLNSEQFKNLIKIYKAYVCNDNNDKTLIFIPLSNITNYPMCKNLFAHELKHALTSHMTEIEENDIKSIGNDKLVEKYCTFFKELEQTYDVICTDENDKLSPIELNFDNFIQNIENKRTKKIFKTEKEIREDFQLELEYIITKLNLPTETLKTPNFCNFIQHYAKDEKEAYYFQKVLRELNKNIYQPIKIELRTLKYEYIENYFHSILQ